MHSPQVQLRLNRAREKYVQEVVRRRQYDETIFVPLETARLYLCSAHHPDSCHLTTYTTNPPNITAHAKNVVGSTIVASKDGKPRHDNEVSWLIYHKDNPTQQIGSVSLFQFSVSSARIPSAKLGYTLDEEYRGKGYMTEALGAVVAFAFEKLGLQKIEARVKTTNTASRSVVQRGGFKLSGSVRTAKWTSTGDDAGLETFENEVWTMDKKDWESQKLSSGINALL
jgi:RimJ/RimL family protein N-acetyltransferase